MEGFLFLPIRFIYFRYIHRLNPNDYSFSVDLVKRWNAEQFFYGDGEEVVESFWKFIWSSTIIL